MLELVNLVHNYDGKRLLDGISFEVGEEEVLCLLGPSGSGKSTILRIIAGLETPLSGDVLFNGRSILNEPVFKRNFGLVFQDYALFPHMNVFENIAFGLRMKGIRFPELDTMVKNALKQVGMEKFADRKVTELSGGEQQRVALARSLVVKPALLMLDEPLGALDYSLRQSLIGELKEILGKNGISAIYVTHDQNEALSLSDRIAILHEGKILQADTPENLFKRPVSEWCASFLGFHNFVRGTFRDAETLSIDNFGETLTLRVPNGRNHFGETPSLLLKEGRIAEESADDAFLALNSVVHQVMYRGDYYDVRLDIGEGRQIAIKTGTRPELQSRVKVIYGEDNIILYRNENPI